MKFLCDVHISLKISKNLERSGYTSIHINTILDKWNTSDEAITAYADKHDLILITNDQDFKNSFLLRQKPKKLVKVNLGNISNSKFWEIFETNLESLDKLSCDHSAFMVEIGNGELLTVTIGSI